MSTKSPRIVIAGASGYIGKALLPHLLDRFPQAEITALSRSVQESADARVQWKACDLFSLESLRAALPHEIDLAYYLVHSMGPTAQLDQGTFADYDLILADNFAHALKAARVQHLIYLGGLVPEGDNLSLHLRSRLEVEETFNAHSLPLTIFRAGLILGKGGSSFQILLKLVKRLPVMVCPAWTQTETTPVDLLTVTAALASAAGNAAHIGKVYDLAGCARITYLEMMRETARRLGKKRWFLTVPFFTPTLSRLWVSLITNTSKDLVYPLIESLEHRMVARPSHLYSAEISRRTYFDLLNSASLKTYPGSSLFRFRAKNRTVRSVQRLPLPEGKDAVWVREQYVEWLPRFLSPIIRAQMRGQEIRFAVLASWPVLLRLKIDTTQSSKEWQMLRIVGGLLSSRDNLGRLEFRVVLHRKYVLAAIHDFQPALPWFIYRFTQAKLHLLVMRAFSHHLAKPH